MKPTTQIPPEANGSTPFPQTPTRAAKLYETLRELRNQTGKGNVIRKHVKSIVNTSGEKANNFLYEALAAANWETSGSAEEVALILEASRDSDIPPSSNLYHDALRALAIHPDYSLRAAILADMAENKIPLTADGNISVALGYLRDGQHEMALDYLDKLVADSAESVPPWVWDVFIYNLASQGFADEAFQLLQERLKLTHAINHTNSPGATAICPVIWSFLLDECSRALHYEGTKFIWNLLVQPLNLNPSDGTTLNVLNTAARHRDAVLATQAIQHLSNKGVKLGLQHYEPLLDCYTHTGDLENALRVLCIMNDAGLQTDPSSTRCLYTTLRQSPPGDFLAPEGPVGILRALAETHGDIPTSAMNVLIEALPPPHNTEAASGWTTAVEIYQQLRQLCRTGPNKRTFDLLREKASSAEEIRFVVTELYMAGLRRDWSMYDALVYAYTLDGKPDDAFRFLEKITSQEPKIEAVGQPEGLEAGEDKNKDKNKRYWLRQRTLFSLLECCFRHADERAWWLIDEARSRGIEVSRERILEWVDLARRMEQERKGKLQQL